MRTIADARARTLHTMAGFDRPWWLAGGWAIDFYLGAATRPHEDIEISLLSKDQRALREHLRGWDFRVAHDGTLSPWDGVPLVLPRHQFWIRQFAAADDSVEAFIADPTRLEVLIEQHDGDEWRFRRDARITRPVSEIGAMHAGLPCIAPEIALLYKARDLRDKDRRDFERAVPRLSEPALTWLRSAVELLYPQSSARHLLGD